MPDKRYDVVFQKSAFKEYQGLPKAVRLSVDQALEMLRINPYSDVLKFKKIRGKDHHFRIRIGDYRVVYSPQNHTLVIRVIRIGHRKDVYRFF